MQVKENDFFLYSGSFVLIIKTLFSTSKIIPYSEFIDQGLAILGVVFLVVGILQKKYKLKILFLYALLTGMTLYNCYITGNNALAITVVSCLALRGSNLEAYIRFVFKIESCFLVLHTVIAIIGSLAGYFTITQVIGGILRYDFGTLHPNSFAAMAFNILIMLIWLEWERIRTKHILGMMVVAFIIYIFCKTRTNLVTMMIVLVLVLFRKWNKFDVYTAKLTAIIIPLLSVFMAACILLYINGNSLVKKLNVLLNARILLGAYALSHSSFTLFGQNLLTLYAEIKWDPVWQLTAFTFDCIYSYLMINQGIIWIVILTVLFALLAKQKNGRDNIAIVSWALYGMTEVQGLNCFSCTPILLLSKLFGRDRANG